MNICARIKISIIDSFKRRQRLHSHLLETVLELAPGEAEVVVLLRRVGVPGFHDRRLLGLEYPMGWDFLNVGSVLLELASEDGVTVLVVRLCEAYLSLLLELCFIVILDPMQDEVLGFSDMDLRPRPSPTLYLFLNSILLLLDADVFTVQFLQLSYSTLV
jgi:hypothetical protein